LRPLFRPFLSFLSTFSDRRFGGVGGAFFCVFFGGVFGRFFCSFLVFFGAVLAVVFVSFWGYFRAVFVRLAVFCCLGCVLYCFLIIFQYFTIYYCLICLHFLCILCIFLFFRRWRTFFCPLFFLSRFCGIYFFDF